jgi:hypothetical protein
MRFFFALFGEPTRWSCVGFHENITPGQKKVSGTMTKNDDEGTGRTKAKPAAAALSALSREIDENLRRVYRESLDEPVPDRFAALLEALKAKESGKGGKS